MHSAQPSHAGQLHFVLQMVADSAHQLSHVPVVDVLVADVLVKVVVAGVVVLPVLVRVLVTQPGSQVPHAA